MIDIESFKRRFVELYGGEPRVFAAPGRVNLIGEHTDYNDGFVFPMAIDRNTYVAALPRKDRLVRATSLNVSGRYQFDLDVRGATQRGIWLDHVEGTARALMARGFPLGGADLLINSDVPSGAGLSASAALEISVGLALTVLGGTEKPDRLQLAKAGRRAEHEYVGTFCGIMDQYVSAMGRTGHALLIDCRSLESKAYPLKLGDAEFVVCDTRVKHDLATSEYNLRQAECQRAVELLLNMKPEMVALRDLSVEEFKRGESRLPEITRKRARHVVTENARTLAGAEALSQGRLEEFGRLMYESHESLKNDYEVSCPELDVVVEIARATPGVYGARMTGGGFGGCAVALVQRRETDIWATRVMTAFEERFSKLPKVISTKACDGAHEVL